MPIVHVALLTTLSLLRLGVDLPSLGAIHPLAIIIAFTSMWAAIDSTKIALQNYETKLAIHPALLFVAMNLVWPVLFTWYLVVKFRIMSGTVKRKVAA